MADVTISQLTTKSSLATTNFIPVSDNSTTQKIGTDSLFGFRNYIINGDMRIDQRYSGNNVIVNTGGPSNWTGPDRFFAYQNSPSTNVSVQRQTINTPTGFTHALRWGRTGSGNPGGITVLATALESDQSVPLAGKTVTLSFYAAKGANYSQQNSQLGAMLISGTGLDQSRGEMITFTWSGVTRPIDTNVTLTTSWQRFVLTATVPSNSKQLGLYFSWVTSGVAGADDNVYITGIQLEEGATATSFERRPIGLEMELCKRFFVKQIPETTDVYLSVYSSGGTMGYWYWGTSMRTIPVVSGTTNTGGGGFGWYSTSTGVSIYSPGGSNTARNLTADAEL